MIKFATFDADALHRPVDRERVAIVIIIKLTTFDADALYRPVDRERAAIVIMIKFATFDADALHTYCGSRTRSDRDNDQTRNI